MNEVHELIFSELDKIRMKELSRHSRFTNTSTLEKIGNEIGLEHLQKVLSDKHLVETAISPLQVIPEFLYDFISLLVKDLKPEILLDPWITRDSYLIKQNFKNYFGYTIDPSEYELLTKGFLKNQSNILRGLSLNML